MTQPITFGIRINVDANRAVPETERVGAAFDTLGTQARQAGSEMVTSAAQASTSVSNQARAVGQLGTAQAQAVGAVHSLAAAAQAQGAAFDSSANALARNNQQLVQNTQSARQTAAAMRMVPAQLTDIFVSLQSGQSPLTVAFQQGGQLRDMFGGIVPAARALGTHLLGLVNPYTVAAAAAGSLAIAYYQGSKEADAFTNAIAISGNVAGVTSDQLADMARDIGARIGTQGAAAEVLAQLTAGGQVAGDSLKKLSEEAMAAEKYLGQSIGTTAEQLADLGKEPLKTSEKLNQQYHYLTATVYDHIKSLEDQGRREEAATVAQNAYSSALADRAAGVSRSLGMLERSWNAVGGFAKSAWDAMLDIGRSDTLEQKLAKAEERLAKAKQSRLTFVGGGADGKATLDQAQAAVDALKKQRDAEAANVKAKADSLRLDEAHIKWAQMGVEYLGKEARLQQELVKMRQVGVEAGASNDDIEKRLAEVRKKFEEKKPSGGGGDAAKAALQGKLQAIQEETAAERAKFDHMASMAELYHRGALMSDGEFFTQRRAGLESAAKVELSGYDRQLDALRSFHGKTAVARQENDNHIARLAADRAQAEARQANQRATLDAEDQVRQRAVISASDDELNKYLSKLTMEAEKEESAIAGRELSRAAIERETVARLDLAVAYQKQFMADQLAQGASAEETQQAQKILKFLEDQRDAHERLGNAIAKNDALKFDNKMWKEAESEAKQFARSMGDSFGSVGTAIGQMSMSLMDFRKNQRDIQLELARDKSLANGDSVKIIQAETSARRAMGQAQIKQYGDMANAASGFFEKNTTGYKVMRTAEQTFRAFEMAMTLESMGRKLLAETTVTAATVAAEGTKAAAVTAGAAVQVAANTTIGTSAAAAGVANQALGDPYTAWARMAAMAAMMAVLGFAVSGSGSTPNVSKQRQESAGTGTVLGDKSAKSESISASLDLLANNSDIELSHTAGMLASLRNIESSISGLGNLLVRTSGLTGELAPDSKGSAYELGNSTLMTAVLGGGVGLVLDKLTGGLVGKVTGKILGSVFGGKTTTLDTGVTLNQSTLGSAVSNGVVASQYTETKKDGGLFRSDKVSQTLASLGTEANDQFTKVIKNLATHVTEAGKLLGLGGDEFTQHLNAFVVDVGKISLKGLSGDEIQKQLESVFSKLGDDLARHGVAGLAQFQQVGEGYFETLNRIASNYANLDSIMESMGTSFGATGVTSIEARERLIAMSGGISSLAQQTQGFTENFLSEAERLAPVQKYVTEGMAALGLENVKSREQFKETALSIDKTTEAGAKQFTGMMALQEAFAKVYPEMERTKDAAKSAAEILSERQELQEQLDQLTMNSAQLLARQRDGLDASNRALFDQVQAATRANAIADERKGLQDQHDQLVMSSTALLNKQREALDASNRALFDQVQAATRANAIATERKGLQDQLDQSMMSSTELLRKQRDALDESNRALFDQVQAEKEAKAQREKLATDLNTITGARLGIADELFNAQLGGQDLQGKVEMLRASEADLWKKVGTGAESISVLNKIKAMAMQRIGLEDQLQDKTINDLKTQYDVRQDALSKELEALKQLRDFSEQMKDFASSLKYGDLSALNPTDKLAAARQQYGDTLRKAQSGDTNAQGQLQGIAQTYLNLSKQYHGSTSEYASTFASIQKDLEGFSSGSFDGKAAEIERQIAVFQSASTALNTTVKETSGKQFDVLKEIDAAMKKAQEATEAQIKQTTVANNALVTQLQIANKRLGEIESKMALVVAS